MERQEVLVVALGRIEPLQRIHARDDLARELAGLVELADVGAGKIPLGVVPHETNQTA